MHPVQAADDEETLMSSTPDSPGGTPLELSTCGNLPPEFYADPYPFYRELREREPVKRMPDGSILLTRYADCEYVYKNPPLFSSDKKTEYKPKYGDSLLYEHHTTSLVFNDPPLHTRVRRLINGALTPKAIAEMQPGSRTLVDRLLDRMAEAGDVDLIEDFAAAIPIEIVGNLLGVPKDEREPLRGWSLAILGALEPVVTPDAFERGNRAVHDFIAYLETLIERRQASPGHPDRDVLTRLIQGEDAGERLSPPELLHNCIFLLNAGHETTTNLIGNGLVALLRHPDQKARLLAEPALVRSGGRGSPALRELEPARQPHHDPRGRGRRRRAAGADADHAGDRRREPRSGQVRGPGALRRRAHAESPSRVRLRHPPVRRNGARAPRRGRSRWRASCAFSELSADRRAGGEAAGPAFAAFSKFPAASGPGGDRPGRGRHVVLLIARSAGRSA
jgi:cytochrome P450